MTELEVERLFADADPACRARAGGAGSLRAVAHAQPAHASRSARYAKMGPVCGNRWTRRERIAVSGGGGEVPWAVAR